MVNPAETGHTNKDVIQAADQMALDTLRKEALSLSREGLIEKSVEQGARMTPLGQVVVGTLDNTGRNAKARKIVNNQPEEGDFAIKWGDVNLPVEQEKFDLLKTEVLAHLQEKGETFIDTHSAITPNPNTLPYGVEVISESASHQLFADNMFLPGRGDEVVKTITILHAPSFEADPKRHGTEKKEGIFLDIENDTVIIVGTHYAGEIKKAIFTILNYELPRKGILPLHSSAGIHRNKEVAMFFGLSGTGKTTLSALLEAMIGDDEHGWGDDGVFNFEGGSYAKVKNLDEEEEPNIAQAIKKPGTILENVALDEAGNADYFADETVANARGSYPLEYLEGFEEGIGGHPKNIFFLSFDALGVLPPISKLTPDQAIRFFLQGYTSKVAGTEVVKKSGEEQDAEEESSKKVAPVITFSAGFGEPFLPLDPQVYAEMLREKIEKHGVNVWMINTGYSGAPDEETGKGERVELAHTKALVEAALDGEFDDVEMDGSVLGVEIPVVAPEGVPQEILDPKNQWEDAEAFEAQAEKLRALFEENYEKKYMGDA